MFLSLSTLGLAASLAGVTLPDTAAVSGQPVRLNGLGLREKYLVDVYVGGLYLTNPTGDAAAAIAADEPKRMVMHFVYRAVSRERMHAVFLEGFGSTATGPQSAKVKRMGEWVPAEGVKRGDELAFDYVPGVGTSMTLNGRTLGTIEGADFMKLVFGIYLGPNPPTAALKEGLLGR